MGSKTFERGMEAGAKPFEEKFRKQAEKVEEIGKKLESGLDGIAAVNDVMISELSAMEKEKTYSLNTMVDIAELEKTEKEILLAVLYTLVDMQDDVTTEQQNYVRYVKRRIGVDDSQKLKDLSMIAKIDSTEDRVAILKCVMMFWFLEKHNHNYIEENKDIISYFRVFENEIKSIQELIDREYKGSGVEIIEDDYCDCVERDNCKKDKVYREIGEKENIPISNECAQIYFNDCWLYDKNKKYIESSSYIIYAEGDKIIRLHKNVGKKDILLDDIKDAQEFINKRKITTFSDMGYYVIDNDLYYIDLDTLDKGFIFHIDEEKEKDGVKYEVKELCVYKSEKIICKNKYIYIIDFEKGIESAQKISVGKLTGNYTLRDDYLYFVDDDGNLADLEKVGYVVKKYGIINNQTTIVSNAFGEHKLLDSIRADYQLILEGMHDEYYYCIFSYKGIGSTENVGFDCYYVDTDSNALATVKRFYIWNSRVYQIEQFYNNLIYVNADKGYSLIAHDFLTDKKTVLKKKYGHDEKSSFTEKLLLGKSEFQNPYRYMRLGNWIWTKGQDLSTPEIFSI